MTSLRDHIEALGFRLFLGTSRALGIERASGLGNRLLRLIGRHFPRHCKVLRNLEIAFPDRDAAWRERTAVAMWGDFGRSPRRICLSAGPLQRGRRLPDRLRRPCRYGGARQRGPAHRVRRRAPGQLEPACHRRPSHRPSAERPLSKAQEPLSRSGDRALAQSDALRLHRRRRARTESHARRAPQRQLHRPVHRPPFTRRRARSLLRLRDTDADHRRTPGAQDRKRLHPRQNGASARRPLSHLALSGDHARHRRRGRPRNARVR